MKRLDRRALFASGAAAALLAATGAGMAQTPRRGGTLRVAVPREGAFLARVARAAVYDQLTEVAPDGVLRGELATGWRSDETARRWEFRLRQEVSFHDGRLMTGADVIASIEAHLLTGELQIAGLRSLDLSSTGDVVFDLADGSPHLPFRLADTGLVIAPDGDICAALADLNGTGLYRVDRAQDERHFRARRTEENYRSEIAGWLDALDLIVIPDPSVRAEALRDGFVDVAALPVTKGLQGQFHFHPSDDDVALAAAKHVALPPRISARAPLDEYRIAERWWMA
ncbi:ABC transporter substrate-binding protein [Tritonibacter mobilis]|uniref:ABC transporter substrate-binding protein n=1 Tax=Tritonibacter mobilis TaxID=379347 RepID=UPI001CD9D855|nr:ABC transporter substrate-binding protein [Tritonibacter mobilis]MCA2006064.1 ABC transporter substrate-binding protein [Tritonibacter mobilis]